jgi:cytochrome c-type biogenesis protein CcmH/NrfG
MPDLLQLVILVLVLLAAGLVVAGPLLWPVQASVEPPLPEEDAAGLALRHRIAVESLRDVEADHRAGSLDEQGYELARADAEERAARTLAALEEARPLRSGGAPGESRGSRSSRKIAGVLGAGIVVLVLAGYFLPAPLTLANGTVVNAQLAAQQASEAARQEAIKRLQASLATKANAPGLVQLANLYMQGGDAAGNQRAAQLLIAAITLDSKSSDAYQLLITAYIRAGDYVDATAATSAYAKIAPSSPDIPFFRGLIAYQGSGDRAAAVRWFDAFLKAAPNDERVPMVRSLRAEAAGQLPSGPSGSAGPSPSP